MGSRRFSVAECVKGLDRSTRSWNPDTRCDAGGTLLNVLILGKICKYRIGIGTEILESDNRSKTISVQLYMS